MKRPTAEKVGDEFAAALKSIEAGPKPVSKTAAELELEQLREQLQQAQLEKQSGAARQQAEAAAEREQQLRQQKEAEALHRQQELQRLQSENEILKKQQSRESLAQSNTDTVDSNNASQNASDIVVSDPSFTKSTPFHASAQGGGQLGAPGGCEGLETLLKLVAEGEQDQAEALIKKTPDLLLVPGKVTDLSGRTFEQITAFQYALWAMDYHMWTMIQKYLPKAAQAEQFQQLESKGTDYGKHYDIKPLTDALQHYIDNAEKWNYDQRAEDAWCKGVGGAQKMVPAHVANEYCRPDRPFDPCPKEWESKLPRTLEVPDIWDGSKYIKGSWFVAPSSKSSLGFSFAFYRRGGAWPGARVRSRGLVSTGWCRGGWCADLQSLQSLWKARTEQLKLLSTELTAGSTQSVSLGLR